MSSDEPSAPGHRPPAYDPRASDGSVTTARDPCGDLLLRIANGDAAAFEELFVAQSRILMAVILPIVKSQSLAEEVLQECFTEVWTWCAGFDPQRGTGRAWLITLCRRRAIDCIRSVQAQRNRDFADGLRSSAAVGEQVEDTVIGKSEADRTVFALKVLPDEQARPIVMAFYQGLSYAQISVNLKVPLGTIKSRIAGGMKKLRGELEVSR